MGFRRIFHSRHLVTVIAGTLFACGGTEETPNNAADARSVEFDAKAPEATVASPAVLERYVRRMSEELVPRSHADVANLDEVAALVRTELESFGYEVQVQEFEVNGSTYRNVTTRVGPVTPKRIVVGAHYDAAGPLAGADDNASGVAGLLELARLLQAEDLKTQVELVAYSLEEPPYFRTDNMGSAHHAASTGPDEVEFMLSLEMIGYYTDEPNTQTYPEIPNVGEDFLVSQYGHVGNYIAVVGRPSDQGYLTRMETVMNAASSLKVQTLAVPTGVQGVDWSDHLNYWEQGIAAAMVTDTAMYRNTKYHTAEDTWDRLDYGRMADVVNGLRDVMVSLGEEPL